MKELIQERLEAYRKELKNVSGQIPLAYEKEEFESLNKKHDNYVAVIKELEFILSKMVGKK